MSRNNQPRRSRYGMTWRNAYSQDRLFTNDTPMSSLYEHGDGLFDRDPSQEPGMGYGNFAPPSSRRPDPNIQPGPGRHAQHRQHFGGRPMNEWSDRDWEAAFF